MMDMRSNEENSVEPLLRVENLALSFTQEHASPFEALKGISFNIPRNKTVALVGESGSGKSVTSMAVLRLLPSNARLNASEEK